METLLYEHAQHVAVVTLNRPQRLNAINNVLIDELTAVMQSLAAGGEVRAAILTGAGERAFCVGMDLKERVTMTDAELAKQRPRMFEMFASVRRCPIPLIAAVNGHALGGGLEFALGCDFIYASAAATFGMPEVTRGIMPGGGASQLLPRRIGSARASELIYTGAMITAEEGVRFGMVNRVFSPADLLPAAHAAAQLIAANAPIGVRQSKHAMQFGRSLEEGIAFEHEAYLKVLYSEDRREGYTAFNEKRKPLYRGK
jgi:enoyl-CoA hydratase